MAPVSPMQLLADMSRQLLTDGNPRAHGAAWLLDANRGHLLPIRPADTSSAGLLATMAQSHTDPLVYSWALQACNLAQLDGLVPVTCAALSNQRWAELAPNLVWPWLALANEAQRAGDLSGFENAMHRASLATDWQNPGREFQNQLLRLLPEQSSNGDRAIALMPGVTAQSAFSMQWDSIARYCPEHQDANRRQNCRRLSEQMLVRADNLLELMQGLAVAGRSGLDEAQLARPRADIADALRAMARPPAQPDHPEVACEAIARSFRITARAAEVGELRALREEAAKLAQ